MVWKGKKKLCKADVKKFEVSKVINLKKILTKFPLSLTGGVFSTLIFILKKFHDKYFAALKNPTDYVHK